MIQIEKQPPAGSPLVSVIIVNFNYGRYIECCLASVLTQTYRNLECIIVDNASTDGSPDLIEELVARTAVETSSIGVHKLMLDQNRHQTMASIEGFHLSRGPYVIFVDADDYLLPQCIEWHIRAHLSSRINAGLSSVDMYQTVDENIVTSTGSGMTRFVMEKNRVCPENKQAATPFIRPCDFPLALNEPPAGAAPFAANDIYYVAPGEGRDWPWSQTSGFCYRREMVSLMFKYVPALRGNTDGYLAHGIVNITGGLIIDRPLAVYRTHNANIFAKHPPLQNLRGFDITNPDNNHAAVGQEIINCYLKNIDTLANRLTNSDLFFSAITDLSRIHPGLRSTIPGASNYTLAFLVRNRVAIERAFGGNIFRNWLRRCIETPRDLLLVGLTWLGFCSGHAR